jgi:hypothetical protein
VLNIEKRRPLDILMCLECSQLYVTLNAFQSDIDISGAQQHIIAVSCRTRQQDYRDNNKIRFRVMKQYQLCKDVYKEKLTSVNYGYESEILRVKIDSAVKTTRAYFVSS